MRAALLGCAILLVATASSQAIITEWVCTPDGDPALSMAPNSATNPTADSNNEYWLEMAGRQYYGPAHIEGDITTNNDLDPTVWIVEALDNYTNFTWTDYHITIGMNKPFTVVGVLTPFGWTSTPASPTVPITPTAGMPLPGDTSPGTGWVANIDYYAGPGFEIDPGENGTFGLAVAFQGSVGFWTGQWPTPEPATLGLLAIGSLMLRRTRR